MTAGIRGSLLVSMVLVLGLGGRASAQSRDSATTAPDSLVPKLAADTASAGALGRARQRFARAFGFESAARMSDRFTANADVSADGTYLDPVRFGEYAAALRVTRSAWKAHTSSITGPNLVEDVGEYQFTAGGKLFQGSYRITWVYEGASKWRIRQMRLMTR